MTTNLSESVNSMLKNTRHLSVSSLVEETYFKIAKLFAIRGRQTQAMINFGSQYSKVVSDAMNSDQQESNTHIIIEFDIHNHTFIIIETQSQFQTPRLPGRFRVMLQSQKCDYGEYQAKHLLYSQVMATCKSVNVDPMNYVPNADAIHFTTPFARLPELLWCHTNQCGKNMNEISGVLIQGERGPQRVVSFQLAFLLTWTKTKKKMNGKVEKNMEFAGNMIITETIVLTYLHLKFFLSFGSKVWLHKFNFKFLSFGSKVWLHMHEKLQNYP
ncbi:hypothetical protein HKD37_14G040752 [Glycine soja]